jgi:calcineurin-like phosphoesterase family protein
VAEFWFTSDHHFGHENIIGYASRPFANAAEMDERMIEAWNDYVDPRDEVWYLGDFALGHTKDEVAEILRRVNGRIHFLFGNHDDRNISKWAGEFREMGVLASTHSGFEEVKIGGQRMVLCHYAMHVWNRSHHGAWMLHGHSHGNLPDDPGKLRIDVGVDWVAKHLSFSRTEEQGLPWPTDYRPIAFTEIAEIMRGRRFEAVDHHGAT